jgi:hypothetical protein
LKGRGFQPRRQEHNPQSDVIPSHAEAQSAENAEESAFFTSGLEANAFGRRSVSSAAICGYGKLQPAGGLASRILPL